MAEQMFKEKQHVVLNHDFRVFIYGTEVTPFVTQSITINRTDREGTGLCTFILSNPNNIFVVTPENLGYENFYNKEKDKIGLRKIKNKNEQKKRESNYSNLQKRTEERIEKLNEELKQIEGSDYDDLQEQSKSKQSKLSRLNRTINSLNNQRKRAVEELHLSPTIRRRTEEEINKNINEIDRKIEVVKGQIATTSASKNETIRSKFLKRSIEQEKKIQQEISEIASGKEEKFTNARFRVSNIYDSRETDIYSEFVKQQLFINKKAMNDLSKPDPITGQKMYSLDIGSVIFHKNDAVRVFISDPQSEAAISQEDDKGRWIPMFTGFIQSHPKSTEYRQGMSTITISCYDIKALMQKSRVQTNWYLTSKKMPKQIRFKEDAGYFRDVVRKGNNGFMNSYAGTTFDRIILELTTGVTSFDEGFLDNNRGKIGAYIITSKGLSSRIENNKDIAFGNFVPGAKFEFSGLKQGQTQEQVVEMLEEWNDLLVFGTNMKFFTSKEVEDVGAGTKLYGEYDPWDGAVHALLPAKGVGDNSTIKLFDQVRTIKNEHGTQLEFSTRYDLINEVCNRIDYQWHVNGIGDIVFEFPMYDFDPSDFGKYRDTYVINETLYEDLINDESGDIVSGIQLTGERSSSDVESTQAKIGSWKQQTYVKSDHLASRYGVTIEQYQVPYIFANTLGQRKALETQGLVEFIKKLANANEIDMQFCYRPYLYPNKPIINVENRRAGWISGIAFAFNLFADVTSGVTIKYVRHADEEGNYRFIFGGKSLPISYKKGTIQISKKGSDGIDVLSS